MYKSADDKVDIFVPTLVWSCPPRQLYPWQSCMPKHSMERFGFPCMSPSLLLSSYYALMIFPLSLQISDETAFLLFNLSLFLQVSIHPDQKCHKMLVTRICMAGSFECKVSHQTKTTISKMHVKCEVVHDLDLISLSEEKSCAWN